MIRWFIQQPLVDDEHGKVVVFLDELLLRTRLVLRIYPWLFQAGHSQVAGFDPVLARLFRQRASQIGLAASRKALYNDVAGALDVSAGGKFQYLLPVYPARFVEVDLLYVDLRVS